MARVAIAAFALVLPCSGAAPQPTRIEGTDGHASAVAQSLQRLYGAELPQLFWSAPGQAKVALDLLRTALAHGLDRSHYDVDALSRRHAQMQPADAEGFDKALSQAMLRFLTDLHFGRVKPGLSIVAIGAALAAIRCRRAFTPSARATAPDRGGRHRRPNDTALLTV